MQELGWEPYAADHEDANCQFEINWKYRRMRSPPATGKSFFKWMVKILAEEQGLHATFMPKAISLTSRETVRTAISASPTPRTEKNLFHSAKDPLGLIVRRAAGLWAAS